MAAATHWRDLIKVHEACELIPPMTADEFEELAADIEIHGIINPIVVWRPSDTAAWVLLDGRHRLATAGGAANATVAKHGLGYQATSRRQPRKAKLDGHATRGQASKQRGASVHGRREPQCSNKWIVRANCSPERSDDGRWQPSGCR